MRVYKNLGLGMLLAILALGSLNCKKSSDNTILLPQDLLNMMSFNVGSYWIYKDSATGNIDSEFVVKHQIITNSKDVSTSGNSNETIYYDDFYEVRYCTIDTSIISIYADHDWSSTENKLNLGYAEIFKTKGNNGGYTVYIREPITDTTKVIYPGFVPKDTVKDIPLYQTYIVNNISYTGVIKVLHNHDRSEGIQPTSYYFAPHIGLIRKELLGTHNIFNLVRYHVSQ